jgi:hypothetical protein
MGDAGECDMGTVAWGVLRDSLACVHTVHTGERRSRQEKLS